MVFNNRYYIGFNYVIVSTLFTQMNCTEEYARLCDEIDEKLITILKASKEYVEKRNEFLEVWRDVGKYS